ncbi:MAG: cell division protein FtsW [Rhodospirillaceae bacterium]|jgi:cell division protein FtsW|nr:cell division protein FtsW [Rhodospirillaceae bacterium]MBT5245077.1 cell division protein FtsW [Rhodospirillaceae bacterium]MBT5562305.1 cell division protein FtsW [Rhodospirillaceae bacterium]MBT6242704.1 cell division protein FtsW [Rhodospirillaceae bacterium]MBT7137578.1 cell division protein FtsW [Rhodospirillaceae bacterium]
MSTLARTDKSLFGRWWWTIDRWMLAAIIAIAAIGALLTLAASPAVAERIGFDTYHFVRRQFIFLPVSMVIMVMVSLMTPRGIRRLAVGCAIIALLGMIATLLVGTEIKGATRWIHIAGFSVQPSEFLKPAFAVIAAWLFAESNLNANLPGNKLATGLFIVIAMLLLMQPDVGMTAVVAAIWGVEFFLAGLPLVLVVMMAVLFMGGIVGAYFTFSHVQGRIDRFLDPAAGEGYQVMRALEAFRNGGLFGRGPGEGRVKEVLPDAHADFIFAVAGEEFGLIACLVLLALFAFVVLRGFSRVLREDNLFCLLAVAGLLVQFGLQVIINIASNLNMIPPKGMTLPFVSYGGSSTLALAIGMGMMLALTRERPGMGASREARTFGRLAAAGGGGR